MDQRKIGSFLKELRKEKGLTQEQLAEQLLVTARTVSRWETGANLPDLELLAELADLYAVDVRELINGERKQTAVDNEMKETLKDVATYENFEKKKLARRVFILTAVGLVLGIAGQILQFSDLYQQSDFYVKIAGVLFGFMCSVYVGALLYLGGVLERVCMKGRTLKHRKLWIALLILICVVLFVLAFSDII